MRLLRKRQIILSPWMPLLFYCSNISWRLILFLFPSFLEWLGHMLQEEEICKHQVSKVSWLYKSLWYILKQNWVSAREKCAVNTRVVMFQCKGGDATRKQTFVYIPCLPCSKGLSYFFFTRIFPPPFYHMLKLSLNKLCSCRTKFSEPSGDKICSCLDFPKISWSYGRPTLQVMR